MDWNGNLRPFVTRPENSFGFLYNYNYDQFPGMEMKHPAMAAAEAQHLLVPAAMEKNGYGNQMDKKKRLTTEQLESLERSFQEEIKLDPERKMKLARELGLQPRQIAVWFQNRRARWKNKQLEQLYDSLKQEYDGVCREKLKLQEEVMKLKAMLREQAVTVRKQVSTNHTEVSGEETVESTSVAIRSSHSHKQPRGGCGGGAMQQHHQHQIADCNYLFTIDDYTPVVPSPYWGTVLPSYP